MMITVPVFTPSCDLKRAKPPNVLAGIDTFRKAGFEVQKTVYKALHVEAVEHSDCSKPEETDPPEQEVTEAE